MLGGRPTLDPDRSPRIIAARIQTTVALAGQKKDEPVHG
jgi:hypothetical protein